MAATSQVCTPNAHGTWALPGVGSSSLQGFSPRLLAVSECCPPAMAQRDNWTLSELSLVRQVGAGAASCVYYALCRRTHMPLAVKIYEKAKLSVLNRHQVDREVNIHSSLSHPHILDFYAAFEDDQRIYLLLEFAAGGDLFDEVKRRGGRLSEREVVAGVLAPYLDALAYLHARGVVHRDIKPENTVFTREGVLKVADFGLAVNQAMERPVTRLGTLDYMAPEVLRCPDKQMPADNKGRADLAYGPAVDVWALGVLAYELLVGRPPFGMSCRDDTMRAICQANPPIPDWLSPAAASFIASALQAHANQRPSIASLRQHPWIIGIPSLGLVTGPHLAALTSAGSMPPGLPLPVLSRAASTHLHPVVPSALHQATFGLVHTVAAGMQAQPQQLPRAAVAALSMTDSGGNALQGMWSSNSPAMPAQPPVFRCLSGLAVNQPGTWNQAPSTPGASSSHHQQQVMASGSGMATGAPAAGLWQQISPTAHLHSVQPSVQQQGGTAYMPVMLHAQPTLAVRNPSMSLDDLLDPQLSQLMQQHAANSNRQPTAQPVGRAQLASSLSRSSASLGSNSGPQQVYAISQNMPTSLTQSVVATVGKQAYGMPPLATPRGGVAAAGGSSGAGPALVMYGAAGNTSSAGAQLAYLSHHHSPSAAQQPAPWLYDSTEHMQQQGSGGSGRPSACQSTPPNSATRELQQHVARGLMQQLQPNGSATSQQLQQWGTDVVFSSGGSTPNLAQVLLGRSNPNMSLAMDMQHEERPAKRVQPLQRSQSVHLANLQQPTAFLQTTGNQAQPVTPPPTTIIPAGLDSSLISNPQLVAVMPVVPVAAGSAACATTHAAGWPLQPRALFSTPPPSVVHTVPQHLQHISQLQGPSKQAYQAQILHHVSANQHAYASIAHAHVPRAAAMNYWRTDGMGWGTGPTDPLAQLAKNQNNHKGASGLTCTGLQGVQQQQQQVGMQGSHGQTSASLQIGGPQDIQRLYQQQQEQRLQQQNTAQYQQQQAANVGMQTDAGYHQQQQQLNVGTLQVSTAAANLPISHGNNGLQGSAQASQMLEPQQQQQQQLQPRVRSQGVQRCLTPRDLFFSKQQAFLLGSTDATTLDVGTVPSPQLQVAQSDGSFTDVLTASRPASARSFVSVKRRTPDVSHDDVVATLRRYGSLNIGAQGAGLTDAFTTNFSQALEQLAEAAATGSDGTPGSAGSLDPSSGLSVAGYAHLSSSTGTSPRGTTAAGMCQHTPSLSRFHVSTPASGNTAAAAMAARNVQTLRSQTGGLQATHAVQMQDMSVPAAAGVASQAQQQQQSHVGTVVLFNNGCQMTLPDSPSQTDASQMEHGGDLPSSNSQEQAWYSSLTAATPAAQAGTGSGSSSAVPQDQALHGMASHTPMPPARAVDRPTLSAPQPVTSAAPAQHLLQAGSISGREWSGMHCQRASRLSPGSGAVNEGPTSGPAVSGSIQPPQSAAAEPQQQTGREVSKTPPLPGRGSASNLSSLPLTHEVLKLRAGHFRSLSGVPSDNRGRQTTSSLDLQHLLDEGCCVEPPVFTMGLLGPGSKSCSGHEVHAGHGRRGQQGERVAGRSQLQQSRGLQLSSSTNSSLVACGPGLMNSMRMPVERSLGFGNSQAAGLGSNALVAAEPAGAGAPFLQPHGSDTSQEVIMSEAGSESEPLRVSSMPHASPAHTYDELHATNMEYSGGGAAASSSQQNDQQGHLLRQLQQQHGVAGNALSNNNVMVQQPSPASLNACTAGSSQWQHQHATAADVMLNTEGSITDATVRVEAGMQGNGGLMHAQQQAGLGPANSFELPHLSMLVLNPPSSRTTSGSLDQVLEQVMKHEEGGTVGNSSAAHPSVNDHLSVHTACSAGEQHRQNMNMFYFQNNQSGQLATQQDGTPATATSNMQLASWAGML